MWKKQRKLIINCVRTTADKCELMHKTQAELILNISVTRGEAVWLQPYCELLEGFHGRRWGEVVGGIEREKKGRRSFHLTGVPMVCHAGG